MNARRVVVVGQGYVGLPLAMRAVEAGYDVLGYDLDVRKIEGLAAGCTHIDDISDADVSAALATGRYHVSTDSASAAGFDVAVITVPTPLREGVPDLSFIESAGEMLASADAFTGMPASFACWIRTLLSIPNSFAKAKIRTLSVLSSASCSVKGTL